MLQVEGAYFVAHMEARASLELIPAERRVSTSYESLMDELQPTLVRVCDAIGVPFDEEMLNPYASANNALHAVAGESGVASRDPKLFASQTIGRRGKTVKTDPMAQFGRCLMPPTREIAEYYGYTLTDTSACLSPSCIPLSKGTRPGLLVCVPGLDDEKCDGFGALVARLESQQGCRIVGLDFKPPMPRSDVAMQAAFFAGQLQKLVGASGSPLVILGCMSGSALARELATACRAFVAEAEIHLLMHDDHGEAEAEILQLLP